MIFGAKLVVIQLILLTMVTLGMTYYLEPQPRVCEMGTIYIEADESDPGRTEETWQCHGGKGGILWTSLLFSVVSTGVFAYGWEVDRRLKIEEREVDTELLKTMNRG